MKTGKLFWGVLFTTVGLLFLSAKFHIISADWSFIWNLWPLFFIFWGLLVLFKDPIIKPIIAGVFGVFVGLYIFSAINCLFFGFDFDFDKNRDYSTYDNTFIQEFDKDIKEAHLKFSSGAGAFSIDGVTDKLVEGYSKGWFSDYAVNTSIDDNIADVDVHLHGRNFRIFGEHFNNRINMKLNPTIPWDIDFEFGAAQGKFDLTPFNVKNVEIGTGASSVEIKLGDKSDDTDVHVNMGASSLTILLPKNVGCQYSGDSFLVGKNTPGFSKRNGIYYSSNYDSTTKRVNVYLSSGVSSVSIKYY